MVRASFSRVFAPALFFRTYRRELLMRTYVLKTYPPPGVTRPMGLGGGMVIRRAVANTTTLPLFSFPL